MSTESASRVKQPVDTVKHVFVFDKFAAVGLLDALLHACDEAGLIFDHMGNSIFNQLLGVLAIGRSHLLKTGFDVRRKIYFDPSKLREIQE